MFPFNFLVKNKGVTQPSVFESPINQGLNHGLEVSGKHYFQYYIS